MADLFNDGRTFNASEHQTDPYFVEPGDYLMMIVGAEWKESKSSPGVEYLECKFQILSGTQNGKTLREILNLRHGKDDVRAIAERRLAEICKAVDRLNPRKTEDLLNLPFGARVYSKDSTYKGEVRVESKIGKMVTEKDYKAGALATKSATTASANSAASWMGGQ